MKKEYKKRNSPRMQSAINRTFHSYVRDWFYRSDVRVLGEMCMALAYGADKYDVLNALCPGSRPAIVTFARGDIRHRSGRVHGQFVAIMLALLIACMVMSLLITVVC